MAALIIGMGVMAIMMTVAMPVWKQTATREKEAELVFRGQQYVRALELFQRRTGPGTMPPNLDVLVDQRFLRKKYKDPITGDDFELISPNTAMAGQATTPQQQQQARGGAAGRGGPAQSAPQSGRSGPGGTIGAQAGIVGVVSKSKATSIRLYNGRSHYNEWQFVYVPRQQAPGAGGPGGPGQRGGPSQPGVGGRGGRGDGRGAPPNLPPGQRGPVNRGGSTFTPAPPRGGQPFGGQPFGGQPFPQPQPRPPGG
jgi:type II secretory pathway pseudopilin PulG